MLRHNCHRSCHLRPLSSGPFQLLFVDSCLKPIYNSQHPEDTFCFWKKSYLLHLLSHLVVVTIYYGTMISMYVRPSCSLSPELGKAVPVLCTVVTPLLNPVIYGLRNKAFKEALGKTVIGQHCLRPSWSRKSVFAFMRTTYLSNLFLV